MQADIIKRNATLKISLSEKRKEKLQKFKKKKNVLLDSQEEAVIKYQILLH